MAEGKDFLMHIDSNSASVSNNHSNENGFNGDGCENLEGKDNSSDEDFDNMEYAAASETNSNLEQELLFDDESTMHDIEFLIAEEIAETAPETVLNRLENLYDKCMECNDNLNDFFQHILNELRQASMLKNWSKVADLHNKLMESERYYGPLLAILEAREEMMNTVKNHGDCLTKCVVNKVIRTCNTLEDNVDQIMSSFFETE